MEKHMLNGTQILKINKQLIWAVLGALLFTLTSCGTPNGASIRPEPIQITGSFSAGAFTVKRVQLDINGFSSKSILRTDKIEPRAEIQFRGTGVFQAHWLVDGQIKERINKILNRGSLLTLKPKLFTVNPTYGRHVVQLKIIQPNVNFKIPELTIFVTQ